MPNSTRRSRSHYLSWRLHSHSPCAANGGRTSRTGLPWTVQPDLCVGCCLQGFWWVKTLKPFWSMSFPSLGISAAVSTPMGIMPGFFSVIFHATASCPFPVRGLFHLSPNQTAVEIEIFQGENEVAEENVPLGSYRVRASSWTRRQYSNRGAF